MAGNQPPPLISDGAVHRQDALLEAKRQFASQPFIELLPTLTNRQFFDAMA